MNDKQRLDSYVLAAMTALLSEDNCYDAGIFDKILYSAKRMMDYVDEQSPQVQPEEDPEGWILNTGTKPEGLSPCVDFVFRDGTKYFNANSKSVRWTLDTAGRNIGDIIKWRKAQ